MDEGSPDDSTQPRRKTIGSSPSKSSHPQISAVKRSKKKRKNRSNEGASNPEHNASPISVAKKQKQGQPLQGFVMTVSTLKEGQPVGKTSGKDDDDDGATGYNEVCKIVKEMGAHVVGQVSKRVQLLLCTRAAARGATQRVRKAYTKKIPIVAVAWLEKCREAGHPVDLEPFRLEEEAKDAINKRESKGGDATNPAAVDAPSDVGWTEPVSYGCSCVCHENGAEKDCKWCSNGCAS